MGGLFIQFQDLTNGGSCAKWKYKDARMLDVDWVFKTQQRRSVFTTLLGALFIYLAAKYWLSIVPFNYCGIGCTQSQVMLLCDRTRG